MAAKEGCLAVILITDDISIYTRLWYLLARTLKNSLRLDHFPSDAPIVFPLLPSPVTLHLHLHLHTSNFYHNSQMTSAGRFNILFLHVELRSFFTCLLNLQAFSKYLLFMVERRAP